MVRQHQPSGSVTVVQNNPASVSVSAVTGLPGPPGPMGPQGPAGAAGASYHHDQSVPAAVWLISHNLGYYPGGVMVEDSTGDQVIGGVVRHVNANQVTITFSAPFGGSADLS